MHRWCLQVRKALLYSIVTTTDFDHDEEIEADVAADPARKSSTPGESIPISSDFGNSLAPEVMVYLSDSDREVCKTLITQLIDHFTPILFTPATTRHMACTDVFADTWMTLVIQPGLENDGVYKPLETLELIKSINWNEHGLCSSCVVEKREEWTEEQNVVWKRMDDWLGM